MATVKRIPKLVLTESSKILKNLIAVKNGAKRIPEPSTPPHPVYGRKRNKK